MIRTTCPKCGREDAVADYLAVLPILCNGCGTRVTVGEPIEAKPMVAPPPPPKAVVPPPPPAKPKAEAPPPPPKVVVASPPPPKPAPPPQKAVVPPPPPKTTPKPKPAAPPPPPVAPPLVAVLEEQPVELASSTETPLELTAPVFPQPKQRPAKATIPPVEEPPFPLPLAGVGRRLLARFLFLVGLVLMVALGFGIIILGGSALRRDLGKDKTIAALVIAVPPAIYLLVNAAMLARTGQDIGKRYAGVRVVNADGSKATEMTGLIKRDALTFVIGLTGIGVLYWLADFVTLFGKGGRTLHDRIAGTRVVRV